jgi:CRISPR/Cas system type I-B associated protein Csh2 (Cas7 group RAMP superfamily)
VSPTSTDRRPDWSQEIRASQDVAYVFWTEYSVDLDKLESTKVALGLKTEFDEILVGTYVLLIPQLNIPPEDL